MPAELERTESVARVKATEPSRRRSGWPQIEDASPELQLLLLCARLSHTPDVAKQIRTLVGRGLDWDAAIPLAHEHHILPLVYRTLERVAADVVPSGAMDRLRYANLRNAARNLSLTAELFSILDLLQAHDIACIPYKGPVLAATVYGDISLRQFADLDVIVPAPRVSEALKLLVEAGYEPVRPVDADVLTSGHVEKDVTLRRPGGLELELHWGITTDMFHPIRIPSDLLWRRLVPASVAGRRVQMHPAADLLLIHCIHGVSHGWQRIGWLADIAEIVRSQIELDWNRLLDDARDLGAKRLVCHSLAMAHHLLGTQLPLRVAQAIADDDAQSALARQVMGWLESRRPAPLGETQHYFLNVRENAGDKLGVLVRQVRSYLAPTDKDTQGPARGGPQWLAFVIRPFRLARDYGLAPFVRFVRGVLPL